jgi:hypothetical protein
MLLWLVSALAVRISRMVNKEERRVGEKRFTWCKQQSAGATVCQESALPNDFTMRLPVVLSLTTTSSQQSILYSQSNV